MTALTTEISAYLKHGDYSVAARRILDLSLDTGDHNLISKSIAWSRRFHSLSSEGGQAPPAGLLTEAEQLIQEAVSANPVVRYSNQPLIRAEQISKKYSKGNFTLKPISLNLETGQVLGVVGENGNGKTTLLRCLSGQLSLDTGKVSYQLLTNPDHYAIKNHIAFIPQRIPKWYGQLKDNLHFSAAIAGLHGAENNLMVDFMLERFNLGSYAHLTWNQISSGYRTRFEIARILLQKPRLLVLDEPLANLDINAQQTILTDLIFIARGAHNPMGIVLSSQQLHEVEKVADQIIFIKQGTCIYNSRGAEVGPKSNTIEFETLAERETILAIFGDGNIELKYNGGFYTIVSATYSAKEILTRLASSSVEIKYFRDITYSTKRFF